jgi:signal transduction histidine kinase
MATDNRFSQVVSLACHDLRTPLATVYGFARTLTRGDGFDDRTLRFLGMIEEAAEQMTALLDELGTAARIEGGRWDPGLREADTLELATTDHARVEATGEGETITTEADVLARSLESLAVAAARFGPVEQVTWTVQGRTLELSPITAEAGNVVTGGELRDFGSIVAAYVIEELGGSIELDGGVLRVVV